MPFVSDAPMGSAANWPVIGDTGDRPARDRVRSAAAVVAIHVTLGLVLVNGLDVRPAERATAPLSAYDLPPQVFPPPEPVERRDEPSEAASAGEASPVVPAEEPGASRPKSRPRLVPSPSVAPTVTTSSSTGSGDGASADVGSGVGAGAEGEGQGSASGAGNGGSGGGVATGARQLGGRLLDSDYPRAARRAGAEGTVHVRFTVERDGRVAGCAVTQSSGHPELDSTTCRLIERRFRYAPARDAEGRPLAVQIVGRQNWWIPGGRGRLNERGTPSEDESVDRPQPNPVR